MFRTLNALDVSILRSLYAANASPAVLALLLVVTFLGSGWMLVVIAAPLAVKRLRARMAAIVLSLVATILVTSALVSGLKTIVGRTRPCHAIAWAHALPIDLPTDPSFPSGHAAGSFAFAFFFLVLHRPLGIGALLFAIPIAASRIALGVHYPTDVVAGAAIGAALGYAGGRYAIGLARAAGVLRVRKRPRSTK
jgi:undecaprenyl-diphosphatase